MNTQIDYTRSYKGCAYRVNYIKSKKEYTRHSTKLKYHIFLRHVQSCPLSFYPFMRCVYFQFESESYFAVQPSQVNSAFEWGVEHSKFSVGNRAQDRLHCFD